MKLQKNIKKEKIMYNDYAEEQINMIDASKFKKIIIDNSGSRNRDGKPMIVLYHNYLYLSKALVELVKGYKYVNLGVVANCLQLEFLTKPDKTSVELKIQNHINKNNVIEYGKIGNVSLAYQLANELSLPINKTCYYKTMEYERDDNIFQFRFDRNSVCYRKKRI